MTFEEYVTKTLAQDKPHHVIANVLDWLLWQSDEWEEIADCLGSSSSQRTFRHLPSGQTVEVDVVWMEKAGYPVPRIEATRGWCEAVRAARLRPESAARDD